MNPDVLEKCKESIISYVGFHQFPRQSHSGKVYIGYARNLDKDGINQKEAAELLKNDLKTLENELKWNCNVYVELDEIRQAVLLEMAYNLGIVKLMGFRKMLAALEEKNYEKAAHEMLNSQWADQINGRAQVLAYRMEIASF